MQARSPSLLSRSMFEVTEDCRDDEDTEWNNDAKKRTFLPRTCSVHPHRKPRFVLSGAMLYSYARPRHICHTTYGNSTFFYENDFFTWLFSFFRPASNGVNNFSNKLLFLKLLTKIQLL
jgi:hypothetical protein